VIESVNISEPWVIGTVELNRIDDSDQMRLMLVVIAPHLNGHRQGIVTIKFSDPEPGTIEIPIVLSDENLIGATNER
jgi:hypothetical protein